MKSRKKAWCGIRNGILLIAGIYNSPLFASGFPFCTIGKGIYFDQTAGGNPVLKSPYPCLFNVTVLPGPPVIAASRVKAANRQLNLPCSPIPPKRKAVQLLESPDEPSPT